MEEIERPRWKASLCVRKTDDAAQRVLRPGWQSDRPWRQFTLAVFDSTGRFNPTYEENSESIN